MTNDRPLQKIGRDLSAMAFELKAKEEDIAAGILFTLVGVFLSENREAIKVIFATCGPLSSYLVEEALAEQKRRNY